MKKVIIRSALRFLATGLLGAILVVGHGKVASSQQLSGRQKIAQTMFQERCKRAGEKIHKTVDNVEGIFVMKLRPGPINFADQFRMDDPYGRDSMGETYLLRFLRGYHKRSDLHVPGTPPRLGYRYVDAVDPGDGARYRYVGVRKVVRQMDPNAPNVRIALEHNPALDLNVYQFVLERRKAATEAPPRYGVTYDDISTREEREYWIAGSSLRVIDLQTNEVLAERIGYMMDWAQGSRTGGRSPWLFAADLACPGFQYSPLHRVTNGAAAQLGQTLDFVEKVLKPKEEN